MFDSLCVFVGAFDLADAEAVGAPALDHASIAALVARLVDQSMLTCDDLHDAAPYRMLDTLRSYGIDRLRERGELLPTQRRHCRVDDRDGCDGIEGDLQPRRGTFDLPARPALR